MGKAIVMCAENFHYPYIYSGVHQFALSHRIHQALRRVITQNHNFTHSLIHAGVMLNFTEVLQGCIKLLDTNAKTEVIHFHDTKDDKSDGDFA